jgi:hypothetical protein
MLVSKLLADQLFFVLPIALSLLGLFSATPKLWFVTLVQLSFFGIASILIVSAMFEWIAPRLAIPKGRRIQNKKKAPPKYKEESKYSLLCL